MLVFCIIYNIEKSFWFLVANKSSINKEDMKSNAEINKPMIERHISYF